MPKHEYILEDQGHFWFRNEPILETDFAPENHMTGRLRIADDGVTHLELDGVLPPVRDPMERTQDRTPRAIQGILKRGGEHVLLIDAVGNGGVLNSNRFSYERFMATMCLVGGDEFPRDGEVPTFSKIFVDLDGFEGWLRHGTLKAHATRRSLVVKHKTIPDLVFQTTSGQLRFSQRTDHSGSEGLGLHEVTLCERVTMSLRPKKALSASEVRAHFIALLDLMILLTDSHRPLCWPSVQIRGARTRNTLYCWRIRSSAEPPKYYEVPTNFPELQANFGDVYTKWMAKRETFGAGVTSYIATRRDVKQYTESQFSMLVQGLESFHRAKYGNDQDNVALKEKVARILECVTRKKDRNWLERRLELASEPTLAARLERIAADLPFGFERERLVTFSETCASLRNDLAHFAGDRTRQVNSQYLLRLDAHAKCHRSA